MGNVLKCTRVKLLQQRRSQSRACCSAPPAAVAKTTVAGAPRANAFPTIIRRALPGQAAVCQRREMFLVDEIDPGLHLGMPALDQHGEFTHQPARAKPVK